MRIWQQASDPARLAQTTFSQGRFRHTSAKYCFLPSLKLQHARIYRSGLIVGSDRLRDIVAGLPHPLRPAFAKTHNSARGRKDSLLRVKWFFSLERFGKTFLL